MKILITHPFCWPHVRRGSERQIEIIAKWLGSQGHDLTYCSTHPERDMVEPMPYGRRMLSRPIPGVSPLRLDHRHTFFFTALRAVRQTDAEIVHSFFYVDSLAASLSRRTGGYRTVLQLHGLAIPGVSCRRFLPPEGWMLRQALQRADAVVTCSRYVSAAMEEHFGVNAHVIFSPVDLDTWQLGEGPEAGRAVILSAGDFTVRRKGVRPLVKAFALVRKSIPEAELWLSGRMTGELEAEIRASVEPAVWRGVRVLGLGEPGDLARQYQQASIMAIPAMGEPSGTVMMEALASGAPVVAANHGGLPEYLDSQTSVLFPPGGEGEEVTDVEGLADSLLAGLSMSRRPGIRTLCRQHAARFSAPQLGRQFEELYAAIQ